MDNKQIVITHFGGIDALAITSSALPIPQMGEVLVKVAFAAVNPIDVKTRAGLGWAAAQNKDKLPWVPGYDISGTVCAVAKAKDDDNNDTPSVNHEKSRSFQVGDRVAGLIGFPLQGGGYSQYICVPQTALSLIPAAVSLESAAALPIAGQTAIQALNKAQVKAGDRVLILAGAGGVGHLAVQMAVAAQAEVYATCSEANLDYLANLGARVINYQFAPASERIAEVDVLIDLIGGEVALDALKCLKDNARVVTVPTVTRDLICEKARLLGFEADGILVSPDPVQQDTMLYMLSVGLLQTDVTHIYPMEQVSLAHQQMETGHTKGKILLDMQ